jgi:hypothetical protein
MPVSAPALRLKPARLSTALDTAPGDHIEHQREHLRARREQQSQWPRERQYSLLLHPGSLDFL